MSDDFLTEGPLEKRGLREVLAEVRREAVMRRATYPRLVASQRLTRRQAQIQYGLMLQAAEAIEKMLAENG
jgi:hypothetical protein